MKAIEEERRQQELGFTVTFPYALYLLKGLGV